MVGRRRCRSVTTPHGNVISVKRPRTACIHNHLILEHSGADNIGWLPRNMMRFGWGFMMKKLIPRILERVQDGKFTAGAMPMNKRCYTCKTVPEQYVR